METLQDLEKDHPFSRPEAAASSGLVATGGKLTSRLLLQAYSQGIFPWPAEEEPIGWYCPAKRAILEFQSLQIPKRFAQWLKNTLPVSLWKLTWNQAFASVIRKCAETPRADHEGTWITEEILDSYQTLHAQGHAHSLEVWEHDQLIAGIYGVDCLGVFSGESMFHSVSEASKVALLTLCRELKNSGRSWIDLQILTPHLVRWGSRALSRTTYLKKMRLTQQEQQAPLVAEPRVLEPLRIERLPRPNLL